MQCVSVSRDSGSAFCVTNPRAGHYVRGPSLLAFVIMIGQLMLGSTAAAADTDEGFVVVNGDVNADGGADVSDAITLLNHLFIGTPMQLTPLSLVPAGIPDTGQTGCYDDAARPVDCDSSAWPGQDAFYATGCPSEDRFIDNGDQTVSDTCTGLMWQRSTADINEDGEITPETNVDPGPDGVTWQEALRHCEELRHAGYDDWRLPNARELQSIVDYERRHPQPAVDPVFDVQLAKYWTSTSHADLSEFAILVTFYASSELALWTKERRTFVLAVRTGCAAENGDINADGSIDVSDAISLLGHLFLGDPVTIPPACPARLGLPDTGQTLCFDDLGGVVDCASEDWAGQDGYYATGCSSAERFRDNGDGTITDTCTDLMWQQATADINGDGEITISSASPDRVTWQEALQYCEGLEHASHSDWRLPNTRELESLVDYGRHDPAIDSAFTSESVRYWASSNLEPAGELGDNPIAADFVNFWYGGDVYHAPKSSSYWVRAVRTAQ